MHGGGAWLACLGELWVGSGRQKVHALRKRTRAAVSRKNESYLNEGRLIPLQHSKIGHKAPSRGGNQKRGARSGSSQDHHAAVSGRS